MEGGDNQLFLGEPFLEEIEGYKMLCQICVISLQL